MFCPDFIFFENDWLAKEFNRLEVVRSPKYITLKIALNLFLQSNGQTIVETGTQRMIDDPGGCSTLLFGAFCKRYNTKLITVDNNPEHMETSKKATKEYAQWITYVLQDSVKFLREFNRHIDLLYLDSLDCPLPPADATESQQHNLRELQAAYDKLPKGAILLVDDNNFENGGKTRLSKTYLKDTGEWQCILDYGQTLWLRVARGKFNEAHSKGS